MQKLLTVFLFFSLIISLNAQDVFERASIPTLQYEVGGFGNLVAGVDFDGDGLKEIYACNTNMIDRDDELIPMIYKFEWNETNQTWDSVWAAVSPLEFQNTWPAFTWGDLDKDNKPEIYWAPVNFSPYPEVSRILVYETVGDGSDVMGVDDGFGGFLPNASTPIVTGDGINIRPIKFVVQDVDNDGTEELVFCERAGTYHYGILSVDDIPDVGGGSETWSLEADGSQDTTLTDSGIKYDFSIIGNIIYLFNDDGDIYPVKYDNNTWTVLAPLSGIADNYGSFKGSVNADLDNDGTDEIVLGGWDDPTRVYVLKQAGDTLQTFDISDTLINVRTLNGAAGGDLDNDGNWDFVFGTRGSPASVPNNAVLRVEFQGGDISNPDNYESSIIDSFLVPVADSTGGQLDVVAIANVDGDAADEVIYTQGYTRGVENDTTADIAILDNTSAPQALITVDGNKDDFYTSIEPEGPDGGYLQIRSYAWNDNGVPTNDSDLSAKVWAAWDEQWFYAYIEVMDDIISGSGQNSYQDDGLELKIDPEATDSVANTIYAPNLTILGGAGSDSLNIITNAANKQYARHTVEGGYVLELGMKWSEITTAGETISVAADSVFGLAINIHDNDQLTGGTRVASVMWAAVMLDAVWNTAEYLGTAKFLAGNKIQFIPTNNMTPWRTNIIPYDGSDYIRVGVDEDQSLLPKQFSLSQNYPNPFNPSTTIRFALPQQTLVQLDVYNLLGEKVMELINEEMPAGYYQTAFNAGSLSSGIYFYRIQAGTFTETKKLMLLK
ncbi:MAG: sugar-binding protein [Ignavibacteria bacterium]